MDVECTFYPPLLQASKLMALDLLMILSLLDYPQIMSGVFVRRNQVKPES
jgi:hypothetical protein